MNIFDVLLKEEGFSKKAYHCSEGFPTIGIGTRIGPKGADLSLYQFEVSQKTAESMLSAEIQKNWFELIKLDWFANLDANRQVIIQSMAYQLGVTGLFKFKKMIKAIEQGDWIEAEAQALDSRWHKQTEGRARRHAKVFRTGVIEYNL